MRTKRLTITALSLALALAGCGGGSQQTSKDGGDTGETAAATGSDVDPCSLLTADEVFAITTDKVTAAERDGDVCHYRSNPNDGIQLTVAATGGAQRMKIVHDTARLLGGMGASVADKGGAGADAANLLKPDATDTPKLGDESAWGMNATLSVRKGDAFVEVVPPLMHDPATHSGYPLVKDAEKRTIAQQIAEKALAKLGG